MRTVPIKIITGIYSILPQGNQTKKTKKPPRHAGQGGGKMAKSAEGHRSRGFLGTLLILLLPFLAIDEFAEFLGILGLTGGEARGERPEGAEETTRNILLVGCLSLMILFVSPFGIVFLGSAWLALRSGSGLLSAIMMGFLADAALVVLFFFWTIKKRLWDPGHRARNRVKLILESKPDLELDELVDLARKILGEDDAWARQVADDFASRVFQRHLKKKKKKEEDERRRQAQQAAGAQGLQRREGWGQRLRRWKKAADRYRVPPPPRRRR